MYTKWMSDFSNDEIMAVAKKPGALLTLELELTRACNLVCKYCYASSGQSLSGELTYAELIKVVAEAEELGARRIVILGGGEPLIYPQLRTLIAHIRNTGLGVDLFTNGTLLNRDWAEFLFSMQVAVNVKYNSFAPATQDYLAGRPGTYAAIQEALSHLHQAGYPDKEHPLGIETIICAQNVDEIPEIWQWARNHQYIPYIEMMTPQGRLRDFPNLNVPLERVQQVFLEVQKMDKEQFGHEWPITPALLGETCQRHLYSCTVDSLGNISPCPGVDIKVGNVREQSLGTILKNSPVISDLRNIRETIKGECKTCEHHAICYGCRGAAYQLTGDYLATDSLCWKVTNKVGDLNT
ncbi:radical SAM protein [bacterium]|nr:radical SAM protein [bacterium]